jgi:Icc-related predicted phosphoesterase
MARRIKKLKGEIRRAGGVDIVVTHAAPKGVGDAEDKAHLGFASLLDLIDQYHPKYLLHGHVHMRYGYGMIREREYHGTKVINVCERYTLDYPDEEIGSIPRNPLWAVLGKSIETV